MYIDILHRLICGKYTDYYAQLIHMISNNIIIIISSFTNISFSLKAHSLNNFLHYRLFSHIFSTCTFEIEKAQTNKCPSSAHTFIREIYLYKCTHCLGNVHIIYRSEKVTFRIDIR